MSRKPSEATQLATAKRELKRLGVELAQYRSELLKYRTRATQAEQQTAEWKERFDKLLEFREQFGKKEIP